MLRTLSLSERAETDAAWRNAFARAVADIDTQTYVIADAYTHAPITPYAPIMGYMGIRADTERAMPGLTALPVEDIEPARRAHFADTLDRLAHIEAMASDRHWQMGEEWRAQGNVQGVLTARRRANCAAEESDRLSDRAHYIRRAIGQVA